MKKQFVLVVLLCISVLTYAQDNSFETFYRKQDGLMTAAYHKKDVAAFKENFDLLLAAYSKLSDNEKADYKDVLPGAYYNFACTYAITGNKKLALDYLEKSKYYDHKHMLEDADLASLQGDARFKKYLELAKRMNPGNLVVLQQSAKYKPGGPAVPAFTYQPAKHDRLQALSKKYNLDSIAGHGYDDLRIINLMRWVHFLVPHDGSKGNPDTKNALSLIKECRRDGKTLNCRGLAIILNEVYLAAGLKSRLVTCLPKDPNDNDCHVITSVYSEHLRKWLWMDPTFMAYVMDDKGNLLSIEEVRDRLINRKPLILNPDANRNRDSKQTKEDYLEDYMAKNLYKIQCPVSSEYDYETPVKDKVRTSVTLVPGNEVREHYTSARKDGMNTLSYYFTADNKSFWQVPPGQSVADFEYAVEQFKKNYNAGNDEAVRESFSDAWGESKKTIWEKGRIERCVGSYGYIRSYKFMGFSAEDGVALFKVVCDKSTHAFGMTLDDERKFLTFRFKTSSPEIDKMLASSK